MIEVLSANNAYKPFNWLLNSPMLSRRNEKFYHNLATYSRTFGTCLMISGQRRACWGYYQHFGTVQKRGRKFINYLGQLVVHLGQSLNILGLTVVMYFWKSKGNFCIYKLMARLLFYFLPFLFWKTLVQTRCSKFNFRFSFFLQSAAWHFRQRVFDVAFSRFMGTS